MDYQAFYQEVAQWIQQANQKAMQLGIDSEKYWEWVAFSTSEICEKYNNQELVIKQMAMLADWLNDMYERMTSHV